jgi:hypothetical protein
MTAPDPDDIAKQAREHAWNWFALHATQRMQAFNFFVVATAFLIAAYASILEKASGRGGRSRSRWSVAYILVQSA